MIQSEEFIYLDNNATTPLDPRVLEEMMPFLTHYYGNASSPHSMGKRVKTAVDKARTQVANLINYNPKNIIFTAGATEAINIALRGFLQKRLLEDGEAHMITVETEHAATLDTCRYLESIGVFVTYIGVDSSGLIDLEVLKSAFRSNTALVSVMMVNNETGVIQPIEKIAELAHEKGAVFMTDATQALGKIPIDVAKQGIDLLAFSGHKFYGPKGIGGLFVRSGVKLEPLVFGGGHELGLRSGTLNVPGIVGLGAAAHIASQEMIDDEGRIGELSRKLQSVLLQVDGAFLNGSNEKRIYNTINVGFEGVDNDALLLNLSNICISNGSACSSFTIEPSHVLLAMGLYKEKANSSLRFSLGRFSTLKDIEAAAAAVSEAVQKLRALNISERLGDFAN